MAAPKSPPATEATPAPEGGPQLAPEHQRPSADRIYETVMRGGGEPFGAPFTLGVASLTQRVVQRIKQRGFFGFETLERPAQAPEAAPNKFTRYGARPFAGEYKKKGT